MLQGILYADDPYTQYAAAQHPDIKFFTVENQGAVGPQNGSDCQNYHILKTDGCEGQF